ncbi:Epimerase family protein [Metalysinibacillus saudimassiliensis]|uniref:Epimerase family protein n=1 Tax=Metalysinibacillus saudimassiliensis TaxID=1461583 RepID=A0A078M7B3_9BACL|nr:Epimerase family protein [Metalysinibacillus saudimassiliensis]
MKVVISGGTGFVGKALTALLKDKGHDVIILTRGESKVQDGVQYVQWLTPTSSPATEIKQADAFVNLAGVSLNSGRWTDKRKFEIYDSRMQATITIAEIIEALDTKPEVLVNASAVGIYPTSTSAIYTESSSVIADDFLGQTVHDWERMAHRVERFGVRVATGRFGVILGRDEGALPMMALPYKMHVGGVVGSGEQWLSWVHVEDVARALYFAITTTDLKGPFNITAPQPLRMKEFSYVLSVILQESNWLPVPELPLKLALGEQSKLVLEGQHVLASKLEKHAFTFNYPTAYEALENIYG